MIFAWCPRGGVGSRRWSKFSKYLCGAGARLRVITAEYPRTDAINWCHDVAGLPNLTTHPLPARYPAALLRHRRTPLIKVGSRLLRYTTHRVDPAQRWATGVARRLPRLVGPGEPVILTVPPFSLLLTVPDLRRRLPDNPLVLDYRDPWQHFLSPERSPRERALEAAEGRALKLADEVWVTTPEHRRLLLKQYGLPPERVTVLPNGYDPADYAGGETRATTPPRPEAVYLGQLMESRVFHLLDVLRMLADGPYLYLHQHFRIAIYTDSAIPRHKFSERQARDFDRFTDIRTPVAAHEIPAILRQFRYGLTIGVTGYDMTIPVKNFEYLALGRTVLSFGPVTDFHRQLRADGHLVADFREKDIRELFAELEARAGREAERVPPPQFSIPRITDGLAERLASLGNAPRPAGRKNP